MLNSVALESSRVTWEKVQRDMINTMFSFQTIVGNISDIKITSEYLTLEKNSKETKSIRWNAYVAMFLLNVKRLFTNELAINP